MRRMNGRYPNIAFVGLLFVIILLAYKCWTLSSQNDDLRKDIEKLQTELKLSVLKHGQYEEKNQILQGNIHELNENQQKLKLQVDDENQQIQEVQNLVKNKEYEISNLKNNLLKKDEERKDLLQQVEEKDSKIEELVSDSQHILSLKNDAEDALSEKDTQINNLKIELEQLRKEFDQRQREKVSAHSSIVPGPFNIPNLESKAAKAEPGNGNSIPKSSLDPKVPSPIQKGKVVIEHKKPIVEVDNQMNQLRPPHQGQIDQLSPHHQGQIDQLSPHHQGQIDQLSPHHQGQIDQLSPHHQGQIDQLSPHHQGQIDQLSPPHQSQNVNQLSPPHQGNLHAVIDAPANGVIEKPNNKAEGGHRESVIAGPQETQVEENHGNNAAAADQDNYVQKDKMVLMPPHNPEENLDAAVDEEVKAVDDPSDDQDEEGKEIKRDLENNAADNYDNYDDEKVDNPHFIKDDNNPGESRHEPRGIGAMEIPRQDDKARLNENLDDVNLVDDVDQRANERLYEANFDNKIRNLGRL